MIAYGGGILAAFSDAGGNGYRIWFTPDSGHLHLGGGQHWYDGSSPVTAMIAYGGGILVSFSHADGYGNRVWFTLDDGKRPLHLGGGELRYDGVSPVTAISLF
jgi:hypothetical protein